MAWSTWYSGQCEEEFTGVLTPAERSQLAELLARLLNAAP